MVFCFTLKLGTERTYTFNKEHGKHTQFSRSIHEKKQNIEKFSLLECTNHNQLNFESACF